MIRFVPLVVLLFCLAIAPASQALDEHDPTAHVQQYILEQAEQAAVEQYNDSVEGVIDSIEKELGKRLKKLGLDKSAHAKVLKALVKNRKRLKGIATGLGGEKPAKVYENLQLLIGKVVADNVPKSALSKLLGTMVKNKDSVGVFGTAAGHVAGGQYWDGVKTLGMALSEATPIYQTVTAAAAAEKEIWKLFTMSEFQNAYARWRRDGAEGLTRQWGGAYNYVKQTFFEGQKDVFPDDVERKMIEIFAARQKREAAVAAEKKRLEVLHALFLEHSRTGGLADRLKDYLAKRSLRPAGGAFGAFLELQRRVVADLGAREIDAWVLGRTPSSGRPTLSPDAQKLIAGYVDGGPQGYRKALAEIELAHGGQIELPEKELAAGLARPRFKTVRCEFGQMIKVEPHAATAVFNSPGYAYVVRLAWDPLVGDPSKWKVRLHGRQWVQCGGQAYRLGRSWSKMQARVSGAFDGKGKLEPRAFEGRLEKRSVSGEAFELPPIEVQTTPGKGSGARDEITITVDVSNVILPNRQSARFVFRILYGLEP